MYTFNYNHTSILEVKLLQTNMDTIITNLPSSDFKNYRSYSFALKEKVKEFKI